MNIKKEWFIDIEGKKEGPFSISDLKRDNRITPDTLAWKQGFIRWKKIRDIPELKEIFADADDKSKIDLSVKDQLINQREEIILDLRKDPPYLFWTFIILCVLLLYALIQFVWMK